MRYEEGDVYKGNWENNMRNGYGTYYCKENHGSQRYEGWWSDN